MDEDKKKSVLAWLNDAYAMEQSLMNNLEEKAKDAENEEKLSTKEKIEKHIDETKNHAEMVKSCIERLGGDVSKAKELMGKMSGLFRGSTKSMYDDTLVKNTLEAYAAEQFEIAVYRSLVTAAEELGDDETVEVCQKIIKDEEAMADWLNKQIPQLTREYLQVTRKE